MAKQKWGKQTVIKFIGGEFTVSLQANKKAIDYKRDLNGVIARGSDMRPAMYKAGLYLLGVNKRNFDAEGRPSWQPLAKSTIKDRIRKGYGPGPILQRTKALYRSLTEEGAAYQIFRYLPKSLQIASSLFYFLIHQKGGTRIPKREMLGYQKQDTSQISRIINDYIKGDLF